MTAHANLGAGFHEPVHQGQSNFRTIMDAMARPGSVLPLSIDGIDSPVDLGSDAAAILLTLCDHETTLWLGEDLAAKDRIRDWIAFHVGAPLTAGPERAAFALVGLRTQLPAFDAFAQGTQDYPDRSTTIVIVCASLDGGVPLTLSGPGIADRSSIAPVGLPADIVSRLADNRARFPRGIDLILVADGAVAALPRTTIVEISEA